MCFVLGLDKRFSIKFNLQITLFINSSGLSSSATNLVARAANTQVPLQATLFPLGESVKLFSVISILGLPFFFPLVRVVHFESSFFLAGGDAQKQSVLTVVSPVAADPSLGADESGIPKYPAAAHTPSGSTLGPKEPQDVKVVIVRSSGLPIHPGFQRPDEDVLSPR